MRPGKRIELAVCKTLETQVSHAKKRDATYHCSNKIAAAMLRLSLLASSLFAAVHADVSFTPGPGLKKNPDGTYSRTYDAAAEGAAAGENEGLPAWQNALLVGCAAAAFYFYSSGHRPQMPRMPQRAARPAPKASARDVDEARAARLARFTGDGPAQNQAAFEAALASAAPAAPVATGAPRRLRSRAWRRWGRSRSATERTTPTRFFGGDSTAQYKQVAVVVASGAALVVTYVS